MIGANPKRQVGTRLMALQHLRIGFVYLSVAIALPDQSISQHQVTGKQLAGRWCGECHDIAGRTTSDAAPGFHTLANDPSHSRNSLSVFLVKPRPPMPQLMLGGKKIDDLVSYILSLETD